MYGSLLRYKRGEAISFHEDIRVKGDHSPLKYVISY